MKKFIILLIVMLVLTGCSLKKMFVRENEKVEYLTGKHYVEMKVKDYGVINLELDADIAPITVTNFMKLVNEKFYDELTFHRIINGFMVQGGDPYADGTGGSRDKIKGEFLANGVENDLSHTRGVISMARSDDYNSASSQFFIMHQDNTDLDYYYAAFGHVISGMDVVDKLVLVETIEGMDGFVDKSKQPVIEYVKEIVKED